MLIGYLALTGCAKTSRPFGPSSDDFAYGEITLGPLSLPKAESGVYLENNMPDKELQANLPNQFSLRRAMDGNHSKMQGVSSSLVFADFHPDRPNQIMAYKYSLIYQVNGNTVQVQANLQQAGPTYRNALGEMSKIVPLGSATFATQNHRAYVKLRKGLEIAEVASGPGTLQWAIHQGASATAATVAAQVDCENAKRMAGRLSNQVFGQFADNCQLAVTSMELCEGDITKLSCVPPAPVTVDNPFSNVGEISTTSQSPVHALNVARRQYIFSAQAAPQAQADVTFYSKQISSTNDNNATLCKDKFEAKAWTLGNRVNNKCKVVPAPSPTAKNGKLACAVKVSFDQANSYLEKNCYVLGSFAGGDEAIEVVQLLLP